VVKLSLILVAALAVADTEPPAGIRVQPGQAVRCGYADGCYISNGAMLDKIWEEAKEEGRKSCGKAV
jgi:hypothetical protein